MEYASLHQFHAYIQTNDDTGVVFLISSSDASILDLTNEVDFQQLIFTRQWFASGKEVAELPDTDRLSDIIAKAKEFEVDFYDVELDYADTNEGKSLNKFCKQFRPHLINALKKGKLMSAHSRWRLHLFFTDSIHVTIGIAPIDNSSPDAMGIKRLKMPGDAPSRSTLKMEEAIHWFLDQDQQTELIKNGMRVVDLGAAPGGWTWQFVKRDCLVTAIDNGPMDDNLMKTGMVDHLMTDAFTYKPDKQVDWLVCDMAERPLHVSRLIARWFTDGFCRHAIFNLKLPMKKRYASVKDCLDLLEEQLTSKNIDHQIQAKHLYHDREEITVCILSS
jgi:23S rRNA (cytidine2498-2'-O)-methyltransferase